MGDGAGFRTVPIGEEHDIKRIIHEKITLLTQQDICPLKQEVRYQDKNKKTHRNSADYRSIFMIYYSIYNTRRPVAGKSSSFPKHGRDMKKPAFRVDLIAAGHFRLITEL